MKPSLPIDPMEGMCLFLSGDAVPTTRALKRAGLPPGGRGLRAGTQPPARRRQLPLAATARIIRTPSNQVPEPSSDQAGE
jgi:hypothetical protein